MARERPFVLHPSLELSIERPWLVLRLPYHDLQLRADPALVRVLDAFVRPTPLGAAARTLEVDRSLLELLADHLVLVPADEAAFLARGLLTPAPDPVGRAVAWHELRQCAPGGVAIVRVPLDLGDGMRRYPEGSGQVRRYLRDLAAPGDPEDAGEILDFELRRSIDAAALRLYDLGDLTIHLDHDSLDVVGRRIRKVAGRVAEAGLFPIFLGGDHTLTYFVLEALFERHGRIGVIHFDAHSDMYLSHHATVDDVTNANVFGHLLRRRELAALRQVGVRHLHRTPKGTVRRRDPRVRYVSAFEAAGRSPREIFAGLRRDLPYYLSFDVDVLDPSIAPETANRLGGGLGYYQALALVEHVARRFRLVGADFVEIGAGASENRAAEAVARYLTALTWAVHGGSRPLDGHVLQRRRPR